MVRNLSAGVSSGAKAHNRFGRFCGTAEAEPFQNGFEPLQNDFEPFQTVAEPGHCPEHLIDCTTTYNGHTTDFAAIRKLPCGSM